MNKCCCNGINKVSYIGRIAPTPSGHLHVGHAQTFSIARKRASNAAGKIVMRIEDLDSLRCKPHYKEDLLEDLRWFSISWEEGPNCVSGVSPNNDCEILAASCYAVPDTDRRLSAEVTREGKYFQTQRRDLYLAAWRRLLKEGYIYPSPHSRRDVDASISAPHADDDKEPIFPTSLRPSYINASEYGIGRNDHYPPDVAMRESPNGVNWRFRVPDDGRAMKFEDGRCGAQKFFSGVDFGDFLVWRGVDDIPSYELAVVVDDMDMGITEVVRGEDLLLSTARQMLLYGALAYASIPSFYHCPLVKDPESGRRLAKRANSKSIRTLRSEGYTPERIIEEFFDEEAKEFLLDLPK